MWLTVLKKDIVRFIDIFLAHHPNCECFDNHVIKFGKIRICAGCFSTVIGLLLAIALFATIFGLMELPLLVLLFGGSLMLFSFLFIPHANSKSSKMIRKFMLGFGMPFYYYTAFMVHWIFVAAFVLAIPLYAFVSIENHKVLESKCPHDI